MGQLRSLDSFRSFYGDLAPHGADQSNSDHDEEASLSASPATSASTSSSPINQVIGWARHRDQEQEAQYDPAYRGHHSAPVDVVLPSQWRGRREKKANVQRRRMTERRGEGEEGDEQQEVDEEEEEEEQEKGSRLPPHEELARERAAATSWGGTAFSLCQGMGRTLKGRDLCRVRNAVLKQTGFIS